MTKIDNNFEQSNDSLVISTSANENGIVSVFNYNGNNVTFKTDDGIVYVNATQMAKPFGKQPSDWTRQKYYNEFISSLSAVRGIPITGLYNKTRWTRQAKSGNMDARRCSNRIFPLAIS